MQGRSEVSLVFWLLFKDRKFDKVTTQFRANFLRFEMKGLEEKLC